MLREWWRSGGADGQAAPVPAGQHPGRLFGDRTVHIVQGVAQAHHRLGIAGHLKIAGKEGRIAILFGVQQL